MSLPVQGVCYKENRDQLLSMSTEDRMRGKYFKLQVRFKFEMRKNFSGLMVKHWKKNT